MSTEKHYLDGDLDTHEAFLASQRTPLIWQIIERLSSHLRRKPGSDTLEPDLSHSPGSPSIYKSVRLR